MLRQPPASSTPAYHRHKPPAADEEDENEAVLMRWNVEGLTKRSVDLWNIMPTAAPIHPGPAIVFEQTGILPGIFPLASESPGYGYGYGYG